MTPQREILTEREGAVGWIRINRPARLNAFSQTMREDLETALQQMEKDPEIRCVILTGVGRAFCTGGDVGVMKQLIEENDIEEERSPHESLLAIQEASARAVELVRRILMFSRYQQPERKSCSLVPIIAEALELLRGSLPHGVGIETHYPEQSPLVLADPEQIHQVVMNLGANAAYAIGERGTIQVVVDSIPGSHEELENNIEVRADRYVRITLSDTGAGMDDTILERIFEPFFTTKPTGHGTGLGLSVVHGIVKGHEGCVTVQSRPASAS
jgi:signal transduction histidine kinase